MNHIPLFLSFGEPLNVMGKKLLENRADIEVLIDVFYEKVLEHDELSYYFQDAIKNWSHHKERFVLFWAHHILFEDTYNGTILDRHVQVDQQYDKGFKKEHFNDWARMFVETVDQLFAGEKAELAKETAENMARNIYMKMFVNRRSEF